MERPYKGRLQWVFDYRMRMSQDGQGGRMIIIEHDPNETATVKLCVEAAISSSTNMAPVRVEVVTNHEERWFVVVAGELGQSGLTDIARRFSQIISKLRKSEGYVAVKPQRRLKEQVPPRGAQFVLLLIPRRSREHLIGDLEEEYRTVVLPEYGRFWAGLWYWGQALWAIGPYLWKGLKRVLGWAVIVKLIGG